MAPLIEQVGAFCARHALLPPGATVVVAVSGGPDSLCLLDLLRRLAPARAIRLHVAHLDHGLRPEAAEDARFVAETAAAWQLPATIGRADVAALALAQRQGIEAAAREARLGFLIATAHEVGATAIALGHTADDQAETVILRLLRGAGPSGLAAMRPSRTAFPPSSEHPTPPPLIRPLLETTRAEVEQYCAAQSLQPRHDPTNAQPIHTRNRVRGYILPLLKTYNASIVTTLGRTARICAEEDELLDDLVDRAWPALAMADERGVWLDRARFDALHRALQRRALRRAAALLVADIEIEARHLDLALAAIAAGRRRIQWPRGLWIAIRKTELGMTLDRPL